MVAEQAENEEVVAGAEGGAAGARDDGRTRCAWVRGRPEHDFFHDAEWGRVPDSDPPTFERVLLAALMHGRASGRELVEVLDHRQEIYDATSGWDMAATAALDDAALDALVARSAGGLLGDRAVADRVREIARACVETAKEYKTLRDYFFALPSLSVDETLEEMQARFPGFTREDAADLMEQVGALGIDPHSRDCWLYRD